MVEIKMAVFFNQIGDQEEWKRRGVLVDAAPILWAPRQERRRQHTEKSFAFAGEIISWK